MTIGLKSHIKQPWKSTLQAQSSKKKQVQMLPIYEAMHKVHTHLLTEESLGCQPLLFVVPEVGL